MGGNDLPNYPSYLEDCALRLTDDFKHGAKASAWIPLSIIDDDFAFSTHIKYRIYGHSHAGDGMAFVMQQDPQGADALGASNGNLGIYRGVKSALVIEMDSYNNGAGFKDSYKYAIHVTNIKHDGTIVELAEVETTFRNSESVSGGLWVDYDGETLSVSHSATDANSKPSSPIATARIDLSTFFDSMEPLYYGFTAATGGATDNHDVLGFSFTQG